MGIDDRATWLIIGGVIGFFAGYLTKSFREMKEELHDMKNLVKQIVDKTKKDEGGFVRIPIVADLALLCVVVLTVWASFSSQQASNGVRDAQHTIDQVTRCNQVYLSRTIAALNERTTYTRNQASANVELQRAQAEMIGILIKEPPYPEQQRDAAVRRYFTALTEFVQANSNYEDSADENPYPSDEDFAACIREGVKGD